MYKTGAKTKWQRRDSNLRPRAYESPALPLSYAASVMISGSGIV